MGASQSYQKPTALPIDFENDIDNLTDFLSSSSTTSVLSEAGASATSAAGAAADAAAGAAAVAAGKNTLNKIRRSIDLIMLYDNYNLKNGVIIKDLSKKYKNQLAEIKKRTEYTDLIKYDLNVIKNKINKNNKINKTLLIFIIIFVLLIIIFGFLTALKFVKV